MGWGAVWLELCNLAASGSKPLPLHSLVESLFEPLPAGPVLSKRGRKEGFKRNVDP